MGRMMKNKKKRNQTEREVEQLQDEGAREEIKTQKLMEFLIIKKEDEEPSWSKAKGHLGPIFLSTFSCIVAAYSLQLYYLSIGLCR